MELFGYDGASVGEECHGWIERLPMPEMTAEMKEEIEALEEDGRRFGIEIQLPDRPPPFVGVLPGWQEPEGTRLLFMEIPAT